LSLNWIASERIAPHALALNSIFFQSCLPKRASTALPGPARRNVRVSRRLDSFDAIDQFDRISNSNYSYFVLV
jgi:hypothetical protein